MPRLITILLCCLMPALAAAEQVSITSLTRYSGNPIVPFSAWPLTNNNGGQVAEPCIIVNPADSSKLIMYFSAFDTISTSTGARMDGLAADPQGGWNLPGAVFTTIPRGGAGTWDSQYIRVSSCFINAGTVYLYYTGYNGSFDQIGLTTSTDGLTFQKYSGNPILSPTGDETFVSQPAVVFDSGKWYMVYGYRTSTATLPGYRYATSSDGLAWTKSGTGNVWTCAPSGQYCEAHRLRKYGNTWLFVWEQGNGTTSFADYMAESATPIGPFVAYSGNPILTKNGTGWEQYHVATPDLFFNSDGKVYLYYQGAGQLDQPYGNNQWSLGVAQVVLSPIVIAGGGHPRWFR
jgi:hypothetical protein